MNTSDPFFDRPDLTLPGRRGLQIALILLGLATGLVFLASQTVAFLFVPVLLAAVFLVLHPRMSWKLLLVFLYFLAGYLAPSLNSPIFWILVLLFVGGAWLEHVHLGRSVSFSGSDFWRYVILWFGWAALSMIGSIQITASLKEVARYTLSFAVLFTYVHWVREENHFQDMITWWSNATALLAGLCIIQGLMSYFLPGVPVYLIGSYPRVGGELGIVFSSFAAFQWSVLSGRKKKTSLSGWICFVMVFLAVFLTGSRAAYLAAVWGVVFVTLRRRSMLRRGFSVVLIFSAAAAAIIFVVLRYTTLTEHLMAALSGRDRLWRAALEAIGQHPFLGIGAGCWSFWLAKRFMGIDFILYDHAGNTFYLPPSALGGEAHNLFLTKAAEMGIPSMILLGLLIISWFRFSWNVYNRLCVRRYRTYLLGAIAAVFGLFLFGLFENGPIVGRARGSEIVIVWLFFSWPWVLDRLNTRHMAESDKVHQEA